MYPECMMFIMYFSYLIISYHCTVYDKSYKS